MVLHGVDDAFSVAAHGVDRRHRRLEAALRQEDRQRQHQYGNQCQLPIEEEQRRHDRHELQQCMEAAWNQLTHRARERQHLGIEQGCEVSGRRMVEILHRQALHQAHQMHTDVGGQRIGGVGTDHRRHIAGDSRRGKQEHKDQKRGDEIAQVMRNQCGVDQELDGQRKADVECHQSDDGQGQQHLQLPVGAQINPDGLVQQVPDLRKLAHPGAPEGYCRRAATAVAARRLLRCCSASDIGWRG